MCISRQYFKPRCFERFQSFQLYTLPHRLSEMKEIQFSRIHYICKNLYMNDTLFVYITFRNSGGFLNTPTPGGVPVRITSPGRSVKNCVSQAIKSSVLNISWRVFES